MTLRFIGHNAEDPEGLLKVPAMVDTVFILLTFFIMATHFRLPERDFPMGYSAASDTRGAVREDFPASIPVRLRREGAAVAITVGHARLPDDDFDAIRDKLADINMASIGVLVLGDPDLTVDQVARALDAVLASPMKKVSVARLGGGKVAPAAKAGGAAGDAAGGPP